MRMPRSTRALLELCAALRPDPGTAAAALDIASHGSAVAQALGCAYLHDDWSACQEAMQVGVAPVYHADRLPTGSYPLILLDDRSLDPALTGTFVAGAAAALSPGGLFCSTAGPDEVAAWFSEVEAMGEVLVARSPRAGRAETTPITYTVAFGDHQWQVHSEPGLFSPRGIDPGTREMLAVVAARPGQRFLDLGCGTGVVSLIASRVWGCTVTAVDLSARALRVTRLNVPEAEVIASDGFKALSGREFDIVASNPPYHTDFAVAKGFIEQAHLHLREGGWLYLVVKRPDWYIQKVRSVFGGCQVVERHGYFVLAAERRAVSTKPRPTPQPKTTRKHAKRIARGKRP
ncbi:MAG: class I SAM-dependent methyltransferase [Bacillota bacterium]